MPGKVIWSAKGVLGLVWLKLFLLWQRFAPSPNVSLEEANKFFDGQRQENNTANKTRGKRHLVIPIYNDIEGLKKLLEDIAPVDSSAIDTIVLVNDASPNKQIREMCQSFCIENTLAIYLENEVNLGFGATVNRGASECDGGDLLILNTDIDLPVTAVERLFEHLDRNDNAATVTPLTNNGFLVAVGDQTTELPLKDINSSAGLDAYLSAEYQYNSVIIPSGVGFCMAICAEAFSALGGLETHRRGYGEDIAFCLRASEIGWVNLAAVDTFVGHKGGESFGKQKRKMVRSASLEIASRFPEFVGQVISYLRKNQAAPVCKLLSEICRDK